MFSQRKLVACKSGGWHDPRLLGELVCAFDQNVAHAVGPQIGAIAEANFAFDDRYAVDHFRSQFLSVNRSFSEAIGH